MFLLLGLHKDDNKWYWHSNLQSNKISNNFNMYEWISMNVNLKKIK